LEMGAIIRRGYDLCAPAPLFNNIRGTKPGLRAMGGPGAASSVPGMPAARIALSVGLPPTSTWLEIVDALASALHAKPIPPRRVGTAACKEHILLGKEVDLDVFPIPFLHDGDGG